MNHGLKLHPDGTLEITMPKGKKVTRVLVCEAGTQNGSLYYPEGDVPDTNVGDLISRREILHEFEEMCSCTDYGWDERDFRDLIKKIPSAEPDVAEKLRRFKCCITDKKGFQHEVIYINDIRRVTGWMI